MEEIPNQSKVVEILYQIEAEYIGVRNGLTGFAETAKHAAITTRMENVGKLHENLRAVVGDGAIRIMNERPESI